MEDAYLDTYYEDMSSQAYAGVEDDDYLNDYEEPDRNDDGQDWED